MVHLLSAVHLLKLRLSFSALVHDNNVLNLQSYKAYLQKMHVFCKTRHTRNIVN